MSEDLSNVTWPGMAGSDDNLLGIPGVYVYTMPMCLSHPLNNRGDILLKVGRADCCTRYAPPLCAETIT
jgi:hypothetical protein